jgi:hypothetical protein
MFVNDLLRIYPEEMEITPFQVSHRFFNSKEPMVYIQNFQNESEFCESGESNPSASI